MGCTNISPLAVACCVFMFFGKVVFVDCSSSTDTENELNFNIGDIESNLIGGEYVEDDVITTLRLNKYRDVYLLAKKRLHNPTTLQDLAKKLKKMDKAERTFKRQRDTGMLSFSRRKGEKKT